MTCSIRNAVPEDCAGIAALMSELHREEGYAVNASAQEMTRALFEKKRTVKLQALLADAASTDGDGTQNLSNSASHQPIVGVLLYYPGYDTLSAAEGYHVADIIIAQSHRRRGLGRLLMRELAQRTLAEKKEWMSLTVLRRNDAAHGFYRALGMTQVEVDFFAIGKTALACL